MYILRQESSGYWACAYQLCQQKLRKCSFCVSSGNCQLQRKKFSVINHVIITIIILLV